MRRTVSTLMEDTVEPSATRFFPRAREGLAQCQAAGTLRAAFPGRPSTGHQFLQNRSLARANRGPNVVVTRRVKPPFIAADSDQRRHAEVSAPPETEIPALVQACVPGLEDDLRP